jgi:hypothetical protein
LEEDLFEDPYKEVFPLASDALSPAVMAAPVPLPEAADHVFSSTYCSHALIMPSLKISGL